LNLGHVKANKQISINDEHIALSKVKSAYTETLSDVFPPTAKAVKTKSVIEPGLYKTDLPLTAPYNVAKPRVFIPVFPGINCEYDSARTFTEAGAKADVFVLRNLTTQAIGESIKAMVKGINNSQIIMLPGGFSAGDEPDGSGKFIATMFRNPYIKEAITDLLEQRDGLILGICNGFQALIKLGLVPYGKIVPMTETSPTLTYNNIGRHISQMVETKIVSNKSPWLSLVEPNDIHSIAVSDGEGRFVATEEEIKQLFQNGQVATQYVDLQGKATMTSPFNPNGSMYAIEGITSPDGRVLGKMGHSERYSTGLMKNITGAKDQYIFKAGVKYFD